MLLKDLVFLLTSSFYANETRLKRFNDSLLSDSITQTDTTKSFRLARSQISYILRFDNQGGSQWG